MKNKHTELILTKDEIRSALSDGSEGFFLGVPKFPKDNRTLAIVTTISLDYLGRAYSRISVVWKYKDGNGAVHSKQVLLESAYLKITIKKVTVRGKKVFITARVKPNGERGYDYKETCALD